jgi:hypothetical protein
MRKIRAAALALASALLASCSYLLDDPYPDEAQRLLTRVDLGDKARAAGASSSIQELGALSYLESSGSSVLFVELRMKDGTHLLLSLDGDRLDDPRAFSFSDYPLGSSVCLAASGEYITGGVAFSADLVPRALGLSAPGCVLCESGTNYFLTFSSPLILNIAAYDADYVPTGSISIPIASSGNWQLVASGQSGWGKYCLLFQNFETQGFRAFRTGSMKALVAAVAAGAWTSLFGDEVPDWNKGPTVRSEFGSAWLTIDGVAYRSKEDNGTTLTLLKFSGSSKDYTIKSSGETAYFFESSGRYWFMYERESKRLSKLRTWW